MELTKTDRAIIEKLREDARQSNRAVGKALGISEETVRRRTHAMVEAGIIHFGIDVSAKHMGYKIFAILTVKVYSGMTTVEAMGSIHDHLADIFIDSVNVTMNERIMVRIAAPDLQTLQDEISHLRLGSNIEDVSVEILHTNSGWRLQTI